MNDIEKIIYESEKYGFIDSGTKEMMLLKNSINSESYPPALKKHIEDEIKEMESLYNEYTGLEDGKKQTLTVMCRSFICRIFNGKSDYIAQIFPDSFAGVTESVDDLISEIRRKQYVGYLTESQADELVDELNYMRYINE